MCMIYFWIYFIGFFYVLENIYEIIDMIMIIVIWNYLVWYKVIWKFCIDIVLNVDIYYFG